MVGDLGVVECHGGGGWLMTVVADGWCGWALPLLTPFSISKPGEKRPHTHCLQKESAAEKKDRHVLTLLLGGLHKQPRSANSLRFIYACEIMEGVSLYYIIPNIFKVCICIRSLPRSAELSHITRKSWQKNGGTAEGCPELQVNHLHSSSLQVPQVIPDKVPLQIE